MQLDSVSIALRPRNPWEAMDLGFGMVRTWWQPLLRAWLTGVVPVIVVVSLLCWERPWLAALILWWLKPMFDRIPLYILSRATFGDLPSGRETACAVLGLWRKSLLWDLSLGRFDPARSFDMPVRDLEGLRGKARRQRLGVLQKRTRGSAVWLTVVCLHFEIVLNFSLVAMMYLMLPQTAQDDFFRTVFSPNQSAGFSVLMNSAYWIAISIIEPFYVAAGFALYLNRRTVLEGWDVEIAFRRIAQRLQALKPNVASVASALTVIVMTGLIGGLGFPGPVVAAESSLTAEPRSVALTVNRTALKRRVAQVLAHPDFQTKATEKHWKYVGKPSAKTDTPPDLSWLKSLQDFMPAVARVLEGLLWLIAGLAVLWLVSRRKRWLAMIGYRSAATEAAPVNTLFGLDIQPQSLPDQIATEAWRLWQSGQQRAALSLLYRGALAYWVTHQKIDLGAQATEGDCLRLCSARASQETGDYFRQLTRAWQNTAYADRHPSAEDMQQLCRHWDTHFRTTP